MNVFEKLLLDIVGLISSDVKQLWVLDEIVFMKVLEVVKGLLSVYVW